MTKDEKGTSYDGEEHIKFMEPIFEDMTKNIMKVFALLAIERGKNILILIKPRGKYISLLEREKGGDPWTT